MRRRTLIQLLAVRWGFAFMVTVAILAGFAAAMTATPPADIPSIALRATPVYRVEVGAAVFLGFYLATMALVLAMHNRGFTEIGSGGVRAQELAGLSGDEPVVTDLLTELTDEIVDLKTRLEDLDAR
jgi:hypothetical protein